MSSTFTSTVTTLSTSHARGASRQTRNNPARTSRNARPTFRQNSLLSNAASVQGAPTTEPHGFYPAITHFTDAITAVPRDFRRHTSLLKEVDAKAWAVEEHLQKLLQTCLHERRTRPALSTPHTIAGSTSSVAGDINIPSAANSVVGATLESAYQTSTTGQDYNEHLRHQLYKALRASLVQMMMPLDEKNHVINNANEDLEKHVRRSDEIWPYISDEISEEARLGSLKHWALTDLNPPKKVATVSTRGRDAAAGLAALHDNDIAERSERRREALLAKKAKTAAHADSDLDDRTVNRKTAAAKAKRVADPPVETLAVPPLAAAKGKGKKLEKPASAGMERQASRSGLPPAATAMSREPSQQENPKKRKAPNAATTAARKRLNAATQESPKLASSPLVGGLTKESYKKSPALSSVKPVPRGRQNSAHLDNANNRPSSSASKRNATTANNAELQQVASATGKTMAEVKNTMKETVNHKGQKVFEEDIPNTTENRLKGGIALERSASRSSQLKREANQTDEPSTRRTASPRLTPAVLAESAKIEKTSRAKASKTSTPVVSTFAEAEASESAEAASALENGSDFPKAKRPARPRMKDHHGLHDSLSPKGLPTKRTHKKNGSYSLIQATSLRPTKESSDEKPTKKSVSRNNSRSAKNSQTESTSSTHDARQASSTPRIGAINDIVDEPESFDTIPPPITTSRRQSSKPQPQPKRSPSPPPLSTTPRSLSPSADLEGDADSESEHPSPPPPAPLPTRASSKSKAPPPKPAPLPTSTHEPDTDADVDVDAEAEDGEGEGEEEDDPNEQRYCFCDGVSYGDMVACDNDGCAREWFHLECVGLRSMPSARSTWFCGECRALLGK